MITFELPPDIGIGVARGSATRISTQDGILDYSGRPLNLAARLVNFARPRGSYSTAPSRTDCRSSRTITGSSTTRSSSEVSPAPRRTRSGCALTGLRFPIQRDNLRRPTRESETIRTLPLDAAFVVLEERHEDAPETCWKHRRRCDVRDRRLARSLDGALRIGHCSLVRGTRAEGGGSRQTGGVRHAEVRYAERDGDFLAFTVFGEGPTDLVIPLNRFPIDLIWEWPHLAAFMEALGRLARVITWDGRGFGASDPILDPTASTTEGFADDMRAVLRAADSERASLFDMGSGGGVSTMYPATYPERVESLIVVNVRRSYPELLGLSHVKRKRLAMRLRSPERLRFENPRAAHDPVVQRWWGHGMRLANSPEQMATVHRGGASRGGPGPGPFDAAYPDAGVTPPRQPGLGYRVQPGGGEPDSQRAVRRVARRGERHLLG